MVLTQATPKIKVTVLGAGAGGLAQAFHLVSMGHEVLLYAPDSHGHTIHSVQETGCIHALESYQSMPAKLQGISSVSKVTTDIGEALEFSRIIMLILPSFAADKVFQLALPHLNENHVLLTLPGNFAFVRFHKIARECSHLKEKEQFQFTLVETSAIPFVSRRISGNQVFIPAIKKMIYMGVMPSSKTEEILAIIKPLFTLKLQPTRNVLEAAFYNLNMVLHPPILICNAGWTEHTGGNFLFYNHGATASVLKLVAALDKERVKMGEALGFEIDDLLTVWKLLYRDTKSVTLDEFVDKAHFYETLKAPSSLNHRYLKEDLCYSLTPIVTYVRQMNSLKTPVAESIITLARNLCDAELENAIDLGSYSLGFKNL